MYLTYAEYQELGGTLDNTTFSDLEYEAETYVDWYTFNRLKAEVEIPEAVKRCIYAIMKLIENRLNALNTPANGLESSQTGAIIASQSNDGVSVSYNVLSAKEVIETSQEELETIMSRYLQGIRNSLGHRLLFRGIYPDEVVY